PPSDGPDPARRPSSELPRTPPRWAPGEHAWNLQHGDSLLAELDDGASMAPVHSPRPHLHPVRTLAGRSMTVVTPTDHRHHYGVSLALPDVNGSTYWRGRTFVEGRGSTLLSTHGTQRVEETDATEARRTLQARVRWLA